MMMIMMIMILIVMTESLSLFDAVMQLQLQAEAPPTTTDSLPTFEALKAEVEHYSALRGHSVCNAISFWEENEDINVSMLRPMLPRIPRWLFFLGFTVELHCIPRVFSDMNAGCRL